MTQRCSPVSCLHDASSNIPSTAMSMKTRSRSRLLYSVVMSMVTNLPRRVNGRSCDAFHTRVSHTMLSVSLLSYRSTLTHSNTNHTQSTTAHTISSVALVPNTNNHSSLGDAAAHHPTHHLSPSKVDQSSHNDRNRHHYNSSFTFTLSSYQHITTANGATTLSTPTCSLVITQHTKHLDNSPLQRTLALIVVAKRSPKSNLWWIEH